LKRLEIVMSYFMFIVLARAIHVMAGVAWAGAAFILALVIVPLIARHGAEGAGRRLGLVARRSGMLSGVAALLTVLSGIYLFVALHPHDRSAGGLILMSGAAAALLSMAVGALVGRPAGQRLAKLHDARPDGAAPSPEAIREQARLRARATLSARVAAGLLGLAVLAMAVFRYASAV
jgi:uncharacterized membrane protein